jgi:hypothetical protein
VLCAQCCLYLWIVYYWLSLENPEIQATLGTQHTQGRQSKLNKNTANRRHSEL